MVITAPFLAYPEYQVGPPVTEGLGVQIRGADGPPDDGATRYHDAESVQAAKEAFGKKHGTTGTLQEERK